MLVCVVGLGYIGFPTACAVAAAGHNVLGVDVNAEIVETLNGGRLHIANEHGLAEVAHYAFASGQLRVSSVLEPADVYMICVPTPARPVASDSQTMPVPAGVPTAMGADLSFVLEASRSVGQCLRPGSLIVLESTVPPGTTEQAVLPLLEKESGLACGRDFFLAHAPERVLPGNVVHELVHNDRVVGGVGDESAARAAEFYRTFVRGEVLITDATTAEMVKLMENTYRDVNIALANEFALICEHLGINVFEAITLANRHPRVRILRPGPGVGGHCIAVDPWFVVEVAPREAQLVRLARHVNLAMPLHVFRLFANVAGECSANGQPIEKVAILGAAYKANVGDSRESPALEVARLIQQAGYEVAIHDPYVEPFRSVPLRDALLHADLAMLLTDHDVYREILNPEAMRTLLRKPRIIDARGFLGPEWDRAGFRVVRLGVGCRSPVRIR